MHQDSSFFQFTVHTKIENRERKKSIAESNPEGREGERNKSEKIIINSADSAADSLEVRLDIVTGFHLFKQTEKAR
ncbi:hypothetical protein RchiOBHm_Chr6g0277251 [Rosa chinensis]|uniref:Uncharacterized protein n=1 Tax=Rosa chinensis TaxID=74649 RepID=A0A2P6PSH4_ROSCH|nr:hypothetical protein RchiOBHm_Chr6g0277251 [Rosa chinensis]